MDTWKVITQKQPNKLLEIQQSNRNIPDVVQQMDKECINANFNFIFRERGMDAIKGGKAKNALKNVQQSQHLKSTLQLFKEIKESMNQRMNQRIHVMCINLFPNVTN